MHTVKQWLLMQGRLTPAGYALTYCGLFLVVFNLVMAIDRFLAPEQAIIVFALTVATAGYVLMSAVVRRLHDCGRSGWDALALFVPLYGAFFFFRLGAAPSDPNANAFGPGR